MYSSAVGVNGPVRYSVKNTDGTATDKATIEESTGRLTALKPGQIKIRATYTGAPYIWSWTATIEESMEGTWFIQNRHESLYMQVDDDDEPNYTNDGGIAEVRSFNGADYQKWIFTNAGDGYYKITSKISGYAVTVPSGEESEEEVDLVLKPYTGSNNQKWKITLTSYGSYKIKAKSSESITDRDLVMVVQTDILYSEGLNIQQRQYIDNTSYKDEWSLYLIDEYKYKLLAFNENGIPRNEYFDSVTSTITRNLNGNVYQNFYSSISNSDMKRFLCDSDIFIIHTHGQKDGIYNGESYLSMSDMNDLNLSNLKFALLLTCETAKDFSKIHISNNNPVNITEKIVCCGAETVVGFKEITYVSDCNKFAPAFIKETVENGKTVKEAINSIVYYGYTKIMKNIAEIGGNENLKLN